MHPVSVQGSGTDSQFEVVHALPGRARLRIRGLYRGDVTRDVLRERLRGRSDIRLASASVTTGTALIQHDPGLSTRQLVAELNRLLADMETGGNEPQPASLRRLAQEQPLWRATPKPPRAGRRVAQAGGNPVQAMPAELRVSDWHVLTADQVASRLGVDVRQGLGEADAHRRLAMHGPNLLPEAERRSALALFLGQFNSLPVVLLGASAVLSVATGGLGDAAVILGVVLVNAGIGYVTESQAERIIGGLTRQAQPPAPAVRDGRVQVLPARDLVPGDVLLLTPGCLIAADARLVQVKGLSVDEAALTGESLPVAKAVAVLPAPDLPLADRLNMVYRGTAVTGGSGVALVVATGRATELGLIQALVGAARAPETPMQRQLDRLGNQLVWASLAICGLVFAVGLARGYSFLAMLRAAVSLAVAAVPEGLPTVATTTLALGLRDMGRRKVLIRQLAAVETLGSVQVICLDKTGTLTENRMAVLALRADGQRLRVEGEGARFLAPDGPVDPHAEESRALLRLLHVAALCNESQLNGAAGHVRLDGSATENALLAMALGAGVDVAGLRRRHPLLKTEYRAEGRAWMSTWHAAEGGRRLRAVKGSPEQVLALCRWHWRDGRRLELTQDDRLAVLTENERMAGEALRVLGFAYGYEAADDAAEAGEDGLTWLGLAGLADPIRPGTPELIARLHQAGIKTVMITGDQSATAYAIGRQLGLSGDDKLEILDSTQLERIEPALLSALAEKVEIFSRVSPANKLQIVQALQRAGRVVAMTGDGVNDGPALKAADIGVAMGGGGTEVARGVADVVLEDDELQTLVLAVSQGRTLYANIRKAIHYLVSSNLSEIGVTFLAVAGGLGQPLNTMQLLWINLLTDVFPALALSLEPAEPDVLCRPPRDPAEPIIRRRDLGRYGFEAAALSVGALAAYGWGLARYGPGPQAGTLAFMSLTLGQLLHARACRSDHLGLFRRDGLPDNPWLDRALIASTALQLATVLPTPLRGWLGTTPILPLDALVVAVGAGLPHLAIEASKPPAVAPDKGEAS